MTNPDTPAPAVEAMIARLREPTNVCGACGQPWTGDKCGQVDNSWGFPTCYPHNEINLEEAADMLAALVNDRDRLAKNLDHWRTEVGKLHSKVDRLTAELDQAAGVIVDRNREIADLIADLDTAKSNTGEACARIATLEAQLADARAALELAREALEPFATEAHRLDVGINRSDLDHKWTQTAKAQVSYGMLRRVLEALAAIADEKEPPKLNTTSSITLRLSSNYAN